MKIFLCFVLLAVIYAFGMAALGRRMRERGQGAKLEKLANLHARITQAKVGAQAKVADGLWRKWLTKKSGKKSM